MPRKASKDKAAAASGKQPGQTRQNVQDPKPTIEEAQKVIGFYSDRQGNPLREFSNFFKDAPPFLFALPAFAQRDGLPLSVECEFSEKAIMLAKAAMMGDDEIFGEIVKEKLPKDCKSWGRAVRDFDQALWESHLEELAFEVVKQKFSACPKLKAVLLSTGNALLAEAAPNDSVWGIGLNLKDDRVLDPTKWCGRNVLGYALMRARSHLRGEDAVSFPLHAGYAGANTTMPHATGANVPNATAPIGGMEAPAEISADAHIEVEPEEDFLRPISDLAAISACYERYGVVGVTGVLSPEECQELITHGLEAHLPEGCRMDDPNTFDLADRAVNRYGVFRGKEALFNPAILSARLHPNVAAAYTAVHGREDVFACHDRAAWMRPALMNSAWNTPFSWPGLHFDISLSNYFQGKRSSVDDFLCGIDYEGGLNFASENNAKHRSMGRTVQGVLNLYDNDEEDGGFHCVPGMFGPPLEQWVRDHPALPKAEPNGKYELKGFGVDANLGKAAVRVPCPAGTLILFDATLPHGTRPNASARSRAILFLRYLTSDELPSAAWRVRNAALRRVTHKMGFEPDSAQAKHLYGPE